MSTDPDTIDSRPGNLKPDDPASGYWQATEEEEADSSADEENGDQEGEFRCVAKTNLSHFVYTDSPDSQLRHDEPGRSKSKKR